MDWNAVVPLVATVIAIAVGFYKIKDYHEKKLEDKFKEMTKYTDREIEHLKEMSFGEIKQLEKKIDDLREDLRKNQEQLIDLLTTKRK